MSVVLHVSGLTRRFGSGAGAVVANHDVSLTVGAGEVVGLLGHNGAGKTTLVSQVIGLLRPHAGTIRVGDVDAVIRPGAARRLVAVQPQSQAPLDGLTPRLAIELSGRLRGLAPARARIATTEVAEELDITEWLDRRALPDGRGLSGGIRRLTAFAMAVVSPTPLVVLDEPTNDIDAARRRLLWAAVRRRGDAGTGVLVVTHNVIEAERVVDELVVLHRGHVVAAGSPAHLGGDHDGHLRLELQLPPGGTAPTPEHTGMTVLREVRTGRRLLLTLPPGQAPAAVAWAAGLRSSGRIDGYTLSPATLEDAYLALTTGPDPSTREVSDV